MGKNISMKKLRYRYKKTINTRLLIEQITSRVGNINMKTLNLSKSYKQFAKKSCTESKNFSASKDINLNLLKANKISLDSSNTISKEVKDSSRIIFNSLHKRKYNETEEASLKRIVFVEKVQINKIGKLLDLKEKKI